MEKKAKMILHQIVRALARIASFSPCHVMNDKIKTPIPKMEQKNENNLHRAIQKQEDVRKCITHPQSDDLSSIPLNVVLGSLGCPVRAVGAARAVFPACHPS